LDADWQIGAVVVSYDPFLNNYKLAYASLCIRYLKDCKFIATNRDSTFPFNNRLLPGAGSFVSAVVTATGREPIVCGKPETYLLDYIVEK